MSAGIVAEQVLPRRDADSEPFWAAVERRSLEVPQCRSCNRLRWFPTRLCPDCWGEETNWIALEGTGTIYSFSMVRRAPSPAFRDEVPYAVALVDVAPHVRMFTRILFDDEADLKVGAAVKVEFVERQGATVLPFFRISKGVSDA